VDAEVSDRVAAFVSDHRGDQLHVPPKTGLGAGAELGVRDAVAVQSRFKILARAIPLEARELARRPTHRLFGAVAVEPLGRRVPQSHAVLRVGPDDRIRHDLDDALPQPARTVGGA
jgi:hypothetical protein